MQSAVRTAWPAMERLKRFASLSTEELQALMGGLGPARKLRPSEAVVNEGGHSGGCTIVMDGILCRYKLLPDGRRQILSFLVVGDLCDLDGALLGRMDHGVEALTLASVATIPDHTLRNTMATYPRIAEALWRQTLVDASIYCEWLANVGRRSAYERIAHLICEMWVRFDTLGLTAGQRFAWPITQETLGDATGLSTVHVNRVIQRLRSEGLITLGQGEVVIRDLAQLQEAGGFKPDYLYLPDPRVAGGNGPSIPPP